MTLESLLMMPGMSAVRAGARLPRLSFLMTLSENRFPARAVMGLEAASAFPVSRSLTFSRPPALAAVWVREPKMELERPPST